MKKQVYLLIPFLATVSIANACQKQFIDPTSAAKLDIANRLNNELRVEKIIKDKCLDTNKLTGMAIKLGYDNPAFNSGSPDVLDVYIRNGNHLKSVRNKGDIYDYVFSLDNPYNQSDVVATINYTRILNSNLSENDLSNKELKSVNWFRIVNDKYNYGRMLGYLIAKKNGSSQNNLLTKKNNYIDYYIYNGFRDEIELMARNKKNEFILKDGDGNYPLYYALNHSCFVDKNDLNSMGYIYGMVGNEVLSSSYFNTMTNEERTKYKTLIKSYLISSKNTSRGLYEIFTKQINPELYNEVMDWGEEITIGDIGYCTNITTQRDAQNQKILYNRFHNIED